MKRGLGTNARFLIAGVIGGISLVGIAQAVENPYRVIWERNAFGLRPPPPVETNAPPPPEVPPANVTLTAIVKLEGVKHAVMLIQEPGKPQAVSAVVREGKQAEGSVLEVLEINDTENKVKIRQGGSLSTLTFKDIKPGTVAMPGMIPGRPQTLPTTLPAPGLPTPMSPTATFNPAGGTPTVIGGAPGFPGATYTAPSTGLRSIPSRTPRVTPTAPTAQTYGIGTPGQALTAEESAAMVIINSQLNADKVARKEMPPFPPVPGFTDQQPAQPAPPVPAPTYPTPIRR